MRNKEVVEEVMRNKWRVSQQRESRAEEVGGKQGKLWEMMEAEVGK